MFPIFSNVLFWSTLVGLGSRLSLVPAREKLAAKESDRRFVFEQLGLCFF